MRNKTQTMSGAYVLGVLAATQTALDMVCKMEEGQGVPRRGTLRVRLDAERADEYNADLPEECHVIPPIGSFAIDDENISDEDYRYVQVPVVFLDEESDRPLLDSCDFTHALMQVGERILEYILDHSDEDDEKDEEGFLLWDAGFQQSAPRIVKAARLLQISGIWSADAMGWAEAGLSHDEWVIYLENWDNSIRCLRKDVARRKVREAQRKHKESQRKHRELRRRLAIEAENIPF